MSRQTLNQIKRDIQRYAESHGQLGAVRFCQQADLLDAGDIKYPAFFFDYISGRKDKSELVMSFSGTVADLVHPERDNESEVWSDATSIACDILSYLDSDERDFVLQEGVAMKPFTGGEDHLGGVTFDFTLRVPFPYNTCVAPVKVAADGFLRAEDGRFIHTEDGRAIRVDTETSTLVYAESGLPIMTEDGKTIILENG